MRILDRLQLVLRLAVVVLSLVLVSAVVGGILLRPPAPVGFPEVAGQPLLRQTGAGSTAAFSRPVGFRQHAIGIGVRCDGTGMIRVDLHPFGAVESSCQPRDTTSGGYVLSNTPTSSRRWAVQTRAENRWSLVLTQPVTDGLELVP